MFAPDHRKAAGELLRVCKPGGRIGMANWVPDGFVGEMFTITSKHAPPPPGVQPPILWGTEDHLQKLFGDDVSSLGIERAAVKFGFLSPDHYIEFFRTYFGPMKMAFARVGEEGADALEAELLAMVERRNVAGERAMVVSSDYLRVIAERA
jgi:hypothetical protein